MKLRLLYISITFLLLACQVTEAQKVILLQKPGKSKWFMYSTGDHIRLKMGEPEFSVIGEITRIDDSSCTVNSTFTFQFSKVHEIIRTRPFLNGVWRTLYVVSFAYLGGSMINRAINNESPLIDNTVPVVSGSSALLGTAALLCRYHAFKMAKGWHLKVLDFDIYKQKYEHKE